jgi:hypothetical protein
MDKKGIQLDIKRLSRCIVFRYRKRLPVGKVVYLRNEMENYLETYWQRLLGWTN